MSRIVIIDSRVSPEQLHCTEYECYKIWGEDSDMARPDRYSHGTQCASVLDYCTDNYDLISIEIKLDYDNTNTVVNGRIEHLREALLLCTKLKPDIISMSSVSSLLSDSPMLYNITKELAESSIIISALDNHGYVTVPASYPFVIGVQSDRANILKPGELAIRKKDYFNAGIYANCNFPLLKEFHCSPSNSFAVPVVTAQVNKWINAGVNIWDTLKKVKPYSITEEQEKRYFSSAALFREKEIPVILAHGADYKTTYCTCLETIDSLYRRYEVQSSGLCTRAMKFDIRIGAVNLKEMKHSISLMGRHYKTDLIFLIVDQDKVSKLECSYDVEIIVEGDTIAVMCLNGCTASKRKTLADTIFEILT